MKRFLYLATLALVASLLVAPAAAADQHMMTNQGQMMDQDQMNQMMQQGQIMDQDQMNQMMNQPQMQQPLPGTGGPSLVGLGLLSALILLVGSGLVGAYAIRKRTSS